MSAAASTVLVTPRSYRDADPQCCRRLEEAVADVRYNERGRVLSAAELAAELADVDGVIAGLDEFTADVLAAAPRLRVIARYGVGTDAIDLAAAAAAGVTVTNTPGANATAVAELAVGLVLALLRRIPELDRGVRAGTWGGLGGRELGGRRVGILGLGLVGAAFAERMTALGATVLAHDPYCDPSRADALGVELVGLEPMLERTEILSLHAPLTDATAGIIDAGALARLPAGALLVNTARGELIDEAALVASLDSGAVASAALDALRDEPPGVGHPLVGRDDVIVTPHVGAQTAEAKTQMARRATDELLSVLDGGAPRNPVKVPEGDR